jgi:hypothetical protein
MATQADVQATFQKLVDGVKTDSLAAALTITLTKIVRIDTKILSAAAETNFLPAGITQVDFLLVKSKDNDILLRTVGAGTQYKIPGGGLFLAQKFLTGLSAILLTGNGATDSNIEVIVGQI